MAVEIIIGGLASLGTLLLGWFKVLQPMWDRHKEKKHNTRQLMEDIATDVAEMKPKINRVYAEVMPNGQSSIKDQITRIDYNLSLHQNIHRATMNGLKIPYFLTDEEGGWVEVGHEVSALLSRNESDLMGFNWASWIVEGERTRVFDEIKSATKHHRKVDIVCEFFRPESVVQVHLVLQPIYRKTNFTGFYGTIKEI